MQDYAQLQRSVKNLSDTNVTTGLKAIVTQDRGTTATLLVYVAECDDRKLYLPAGYPSMFAYCVGELRFSDDMAYKRIHAARAARKFPSIFAALADGRLHLTAVVMLAAHLTADSAEGLIAAATHKTRFEIERLLAARAPRPDVPTLIRALPAPREATPECGLDTRQPVAGPVATNGIPDPDCRGVQLAARQVGLDEASDTPVMAPASRPSKLTPLAPERFALQVTLGKETFDKLQRAKGLLGHQVPSGDLAQVLDHALDALITRLEKQKYATTAKPRSSSAARRSGNPRYIPAHVRRAVRQRDGDQCTFVSATGRRCSAKARLEFDHVHEVARGGMATLSDIRLRCRAHNQYTAECTFGRDFMQEKRRSAAQATAGSPA